MPVSLVVVAVFVVAALVKGAVAISVKSLLAFTALVASGVFSFVAGGGGVGMRPSLTSLVLFFCLYALSTLTLSVKPAAKRANLGAELLKGALLAIKLAGVIAICQFVGQRTGFGFVDPLQNISRQFTLEGYNTYYSLQFQGLVGGFKPNGILYLEPSFLSLYSAIGVVILAHRLFSGLSKGRLLRFDIFWLIVLVASSTVSASVSGLVVLAVASLPLLFSVRRNHFVVVVFVAAGAIAWAMGAFAPLINKASDGISMGTSGYLRLVLPYEYLAPYFASRPVFGYGSGAAADIVEASGIAGLQTSTLMKLLIEYGLVGAIFLGILVVGVLHRTNAPRALSFAMLAAWLIPAEALVNPVVVPLLTVGLGLWGSSHVDSTANRRVKVCMPSEQAERLAK